jgi:hypothetical protein
VTSGRFLGLLPRALKQPTPEARRTPRQCSILVFTIATGGSARTSLAEAGSPAIGCIGCAASPINVALLPACGCRQDHAPARADGALCE